MMGERAWAALLVWVLMLAFFAAPTVAAGESGVSTVGCGRPAPAEPPAVIQVGGRTREFILAVPEAYEPDLLHRVVFGFHGRTTPNGKVRTYFQLEAHSERPTLFVYPAGLVAADGKFSWHERGQPGEALRDYELFDALLGELGNQYCIDLDQVFAVGHSLGGSFVNSLGCARGSVIRGVGTVAGRIWKSPCSGPVAAILFHNPHDDLVPFERGLEARDWALSQNGLTPLAEACEPRELNCELYGSRGAENPVVWCPHTQDFNRRGNFYSHLWPQEAGQVIMEFFDLLPGYSLNDQVE